MSATIWMALTIDRRSPATGACRASSTKALSSAWVLSSAIFSWSEMTSPASTRSACSSACVARSMAAPANPHISPSCSESSESCSWYAVRISQAYVLDSERGMNQHEVRCELAVNGGLPVDSQRLCYSQVVSAALVTVRSSGSLVGGLLALRLICRLTGDPAGGGVPTEVKSEPSTTCTTCPVPVIRSTLEFANEAATVAAACSLPGEKSTLVVFSGFG